MGKPDRYPNIFPAISEYCIQQIIILPLILQEQGWDRSREVQEWENLGKRSAGSDQCTELTLQRHIGVHRQIGCCKSCDNPSRPLQPRRYTCESCTCCNSRGRQSQRTYQHKGSSQVERRHKLLGSCKSQQL